MKVLMVAYLDKDKKVRGFLSTNRLMATRKRFAFVVPRDGNAESAVISARQLLLGPHPFDEFGPMTVAIVEVDEDEQ